MTVIRQWYYLSKLRYIFIVCLSFGRITGRIFKSDFTELGREARKPLQFGADLDRFKFPETFARVRSTKLPNKSRLKVFAGECLKGQKRSKRGERT